MVDKYIKYWAMLCEEKYNPWDDDYEGPDIDLKNGRGDSEPEMGADGQNEKPTHFDAGKRKFQNRTSTYGGDDYYDLGQMMYILDKKGLKDDDKREVWMKIDDGNGSGDDGCTYKRVRWVVKGAWDLKNMMGCLTDEESNRIKDFDYKVVHFVKQIQAKASNPWGKIVRDRLLYMNKEDESVYVCNGMTIESGRIILEMEWGDLGNYDPTEFRY